mgnify:CR=1 FL=1
MIRVAPNDSEKPDEVTTPKKPATQSPIPELDSDFKSTDNRVSENPLIQMNIEENIQNDLADFSPNKMRDKAVHSGDSSPTSRFNKYKT